MTADVTFTKAVPTPPAGRSVPVQVRGGGTARDRPIRAAFKRAGMPATLGQAAHNEVPVDSGSL